MPTPAKTPCLTGCTTATVGTGVYVLTADPLPPPFSHPFNVLADGDTIFATVSDNVAYEHGLYTYHSSGGPNGSLSRTAISSSSTGPGATRTTNPINWGAVGVRNIYSDVPETGFMLGANNLSDLANLQTARLTLALNTTTDSGVVAGAIPKLGTGAKLPANVDVSLCIGFPTTTSPIPAGTVTDFYQAAAPTGWTRITTYDDCLISITNSTGFGGGGPFAAGTFVAGGWDQTVGISIGNHTLTVAEMPAHAHSPGSGTLFINQDGSGTGSFTPGSNASTSASTANQGGGGGHNHSISSVTTWRPPQLKMLLASKN